MDSHRAELVRHQRQPQLSRLVSEQRERTDLLLLCHRIQQQLRKAPKAEALGALLGFAKAQNLYQQLVDDGPNAGGVGQQDLGVDSQQGIDDGVTLYLNILVNRIFQHMINHLHALGY